MMEDDEYCPLDGTQLIWAEGGEGEPVWYCWTCRKTLDVETLEEVEC